MSIDGIDIPEGNSMKGAGVRAWRKMVKKGAV
jgi:hypothetical protein